MLSPYNYLANSLKSFMLFMLGITIILTSNILSMPSPYYCLLCEQNFGELLLARVIT